MWGYHEGMGWWWVVGSAWMFIFWGVIIGLVVWAIRRLGGDRTDGRTTGETPVEIAQKRLARGEITTEQFEELKRALQ